MNKTTIKINSNFIQLSALLKFANVCQSGGEAKIAIQSGLVNYNGEVCTQRGKKVYPGDIISFEGEEIRVESE